MNFLSQLKLEDFIRSHIKGTTFAAKIAYLDYGTFIQVTTGSKVYNVSIPKGDKVTDTLQDVVCIIKEQGGLLK